MFEDFGRLCKRLEILFEVGKNLFFLDIKTLSY
jgi:hypothetical protein